MTHRLLPWISRDLSVLCERAHIAVALERINGLLLRHDMRSPHFGQEIREFFGENTRHFMHELISFARSPYDMLGYDREVTHDAWYPGLDDHAVIFHENDTSSEDDIMEVPFSPRSENQPPFLRGDVFRPRTPSPEAGPSRLFDRVPTPPVLNPQLSASPLIIDSSTEDEAPQNNNAYEAGSLSDVEVLAVLKPKHERTPEIVDLLSDSEPEPSVDVDTIELAEPWDLEQASTSHVSIESSFLNPDEAGPSTSSFRTVYMDSLPNLEVKSEDDLPSYDHNIFHSSNVLNLSSDLSSDDIEAPIIKKCKNKKSKKKSKRRAPVSSTSDDDSDRGSRSRKQKNCSCKSCGKDVCEQRTKSSKSKKSKCRKHRSRSSSSSPKRSKATKRSYLWTTSDESDYEVTKRPKLSSKVVWQIRKSSSNDDGAEYHQPRIRSIVVKRQPVMDSPQSSSSQQHPQRSDSESSWEPSGKYHKKSKSKDKGKGKGKGKAKSKRKSE